MFKDHIEYGKQGNATEWLSDCFRLGVREVLPVDVIFMTRQRQQWENVGEELN